MAQNLVIDGDFELISKCIPNYGNSIDYATYWYCPTGSTPDLFNFCSQGNLNPFLSWAGPSKPYSGDGMLGLFLNKSDSYFEYAGTELLYSLIKDSTYIISFAFKPAQFTQLAVEFLQLGFSRDSITGVGDSKLKTDLIYNAFEYKEQDNWFFSKGEYKAQGGERVVYVGAFDSLKLFNAEPMQVEDQLQNAAYYYFDALSIEPKYLAESDGEKKKASLDIFFALDRYSITTAARKEIISFIEKENATSNRFVIMGFADSSGESSYNLKLARKRCWEVGKYFRLMKIPRSKISFEVVGETEEFGSEKFKNRKVIIKSVDAL